MTKRLRLVNLLAVLALFLVACQPAAPAATPGKEAAPAPKEAPQAAKSAAPTRVVIGVTTALDEQNPYADSASVMYGIWCQILGCLVGYDFKTGDFVPQLAESWKTLDENTWEMKLRKGVKWHDGTDFTSADVVHSLNRIQDDPQSAQKRIFSVLDKWEAVDSHTVKLYTKKPTAILMDYFAERVAVTQKAQFEKEGETYWEKGPIGTGPYMFKSMNPGVDIILVKNPNWWGGTVEGPDEVVFRVMREAEVRVTALLNNEVQIADLIPPHLADRVKGASNVKLVESASVEIQFLAMSPNFKPWDNKKLRQAVTYAVDRDAIINGLLQGQARRLDGPVNPGQYGYDPEVAKKIAVEYDPEKAKQLVKEAGFPNGVDVELYTPVGRYIQDKQISEAVAKMLTDVGIRTKLMTPEWPTLWANVQKGKVPFYYMGRGSVVDPSQALSQYFETGVSPRIGYSNKQLDELFAEERSEFDPQKRKQMLHQIFASLVDEAPAHFMWTHNLLWGMNKSIEYTPRPDQRIFPTEIRVLQ